MTKSIILACCIAGFALSAAAIILMIPSLVQTGEPPAPLWLACVLLGVAAGCGSGMLMIKRIGNS